MSTMTMTMMMMLILLSLSTLSLTSSFSTSTLPSPLQLLQSSHKTSSSTRRTCTTRSSIVLLKNHKNDHEDIPGTATMNIHTTRTEEPTPLSRRSFLATQAISLAIASTVIQGQPSPATAADADADADAPTVPSSSSSTLSTNDAEITSKIFLTLKGLPTDESNDIPYQEETITIGLFGKEAPGPTSILLQLANSSSSSSSSSRGYPAPCKPKETRTLQREQLEANKVYNACKETESSKGVDYDLSTVWRVKKDERIDLGAVSGKYVARFPPDFQGSGSGLTHDAEGVVSVRRGRDGGFGFTIYPGTGTGTGTGTGSTGGTKSDLDEDNIVVGRVIDGMDVVRRLNRIPVVQSVGFNYKGGLFAGGNNKSETKSAPSRACRYGSSELYCNEFKPLKKILISRTGVL